MERRRQHRVPERGINRRATRRPAGDLSSTSSRKDVWRNEMEDDVDIGSVTDFLTRNWLVVSIVLIGISLRIMLLNHESFWIDEAMTGLRSRWDFTYMMDEVTMQDQMPLYFTFTWLVSSLLGNSVLVLRGLSVIFGVLAFIPIYKIGMRFSREAAVIALALFAFSPTMLYYSQEARMYMPMVLLSACSIYFYLEFIDPRKMKRSMSGFLMMVFNVMLIYVHYFGALFVALQLTALFATLTIRSIKAKEGIRLLQNIKGSWPLLASMASFIPWLIFQQVKYSISDKSTGGSMGLRLGLVPETFTFIGGNYTSVLKYDSTLAIITGYIFLTAAGIAVIYLLLKKEKEHDLASILILGLTMMIFSPIIVMALSRVLTPMYNHRYFVFLAPLFLLFISIALSTFLKKLDRTWRSALIAALIIVLIVPSVVTDYDQLSCRNKEDWEGGIEFILENRESGDVVVPFPDYQHLLLSYYTSDLEIRLMEGRANWSQFLDDHDRVWVIFNEVDHIDDQDLIMELNLWHMEEYAKEGIAIRLYVKYTNM
ncbi:MAG: glycosyltransferase family 39 protein [Thermoplasmatota archaeon]